MTVIDAPTQNSPAPPRTTHRTPQPPTAPHVEWLIFEDVDWDFYLRLCDMLQGRGGYITFYHGRLEVVTVSTIHERMSRIVYRLIASLAEQADLPIVSTGQMTLRNPRLRLAVQADESFYLGENVATMNERSRTEDVNRLFDPAEDPPPDLALEIEVTRRLSERTSIYRELGVPEVWACGSSGLEILLNRDGQYVPVERSPTFPSLSPQEMFGFIQTGLHGDETAWIKTLRRRLNE